jgi:hypothetical protein
MSERGEQPPAEPPFLPRWVLYLMLPGIALPLLIFAFILIREAAHDSDCPYALVADKTLGSDIRVLEERRRCLPRVEERRFSLQRGAERRILGERRFAPEAFAEGRYSWSASLSEEGEVQVVVNNADHGELLLREGTAEERAKGISH